MYNFKINFQGKEYSINDRTVEKVFLAPMNEKEKKKAKIKAQKECIELIKRCKDD